ncbi:MAG: winged helix-turn-helix transcriptional regulator [Methanomicrobiaceae archaeon]|nr:winged helix-turn-helix transcriptional regulator [Methanomicrobiaceae archaeon]
MVNVDDICLPDDLPEEFKAQIRHRGGIGGLKNELCDMDCIKIQSLMHSACTDPVRLHILSLLKAGPLCVCAIKEVLGLADSRLSYHLNVLKKAGLIRGSQKYRWIVYSLTEQGEIWTSCMCESKNLIR